MNEALKLDEGREKLSQAKFQTASTTSNYLSFQTENQENSFLGQSRYNQPPH